MLEQANKLAITDALTTLYNSRYLHDQLAIELESAKRYNTPLTCLMLDIDNFKLINDKYGHPSGDMVLAALAKILRDSVRRIDIVGRLGGEEFLILMPHTPPKIAFCIGERIRQAVQRWPFKVDGTEISMTVSVGAASYPDEYVKDKASFLKAADNALYEAKRLGKNKTVLSEKINLQSRLSSLN
jgi:diguanylate cyclase (GGDEF)-like protein